MLLKDVEYILQPTNLMWVGVCLNTCIKRVYLNARGCLLGCVYAHVDNSAPHPNTNKQNKKYQQVEDKAYKFWSGCGEILPKFGWTSYRL